MKIKDDIIKAYELGTKELKDEVEFWHTNYDGARELIDDKVAELSTLRNKILDELEREIMPYVEESMGKSVKDTVQKIREGK